VVATLALGICVNTMVFTLVDAALFKPVALPRVAVNNRDLAKDSGGMTLLVSASDPIVFAAVSLALTAVGLFACWLPARKAAGLNPVQPIRHEL
jgi:ABC-type lipoprotein release transport system permease subunit